MLVCAKSVRVLVRSGQRKQSVCLEALRSALYVFSEHAICASLVHQWPGRHVAHPVASEALAYEPGAHVVHAAAPGTAA